MNRRQFITRSLSAVAAAAVGTGVYAWRIEPHWIEFVERPLQIRHLTPELEGRVLLQMSDLHAGRVDLSYLIDTMQRASALAPDYVVFTGDFTNATSRGALPDLRSLLPHFPRGRHGTAGVLGNHDYGVGWHEHDVANAISRLAADAGITVLRNQVAMLDGLQIVGLDDLWAGEFAAERSFRAMQPGVPTVVLSHNPDTVDEPTMMYGVDWVLCGHTHGGQCKPPFLPPPLLPVKNRRYTAGEFALSNHRRMYISRGVGHTLRIRFNVRPEVTVFTLRRA